MRPGYAVLIAAGVIVVVAGTGCGIRLVATADPVRRVRAREAAAGAAQYGLLFGFAAVAAAVSAHGLAGFARANMRLLGPWPYLLWGSLDGAAGLCAVLLMRRAARGESALAPRLAVWGLVAASSAFNWTHAPAHPGARLAFALMPVIAAVLFEFSLRETRHTARGAERRLSGLAWLRPAERFRAQAQLAADAGLSAEAAIRRVRVAGAARRLYALRQALDVLEHAPRLRGIAAGRVRRAERRAQAALGRARFTEPAVAAEVLRQVQVLTLTRALAQLDYTTAENAQAVLASMIMSESASAAGGGLNGASSRSSRPGSVAVYERPDGRAGSPRLDRVSAAFPAWAMLDGQPGGALLGNGYASPPGGCVAPWPPPGPRAAGGGDRLVEAAARIVGQARLQGDPLSQAGLARKLRAEGYGIANDRLRWLAAVSGLDDRMPRVR